MANQMERPTGIRAWGVSEDQLPQSQRWISLVSMMITGLAVVFVVMKWNPILTFVGEAHGMGMDMIGNISGLALFMGCIVCFPAVWIMRNIGVKFTLALAMVITIIGSVASLFTPDAAGFLAARVIEGTGMGMLAACGPNIVPRLFPLQKMGLAMGAWSQWTVAGLVMAVLISPIIFSATGSIDTITYVGIGICVLALLIHVAAFKLNAVDENVLNAQAVERQEKTAINHNYVRGGIICAFAFFGYCWIYGLCQGFFPTFLQSFGVGIVESNSPALYSQILVVLFGVYSGVFFEKTSLRKVFAIGGFIVFGGMILLSYGSYGNSAVNMWLFGIGIGMLAGIVPVAIRTYIPVLVTDPKKMDYVLGIMAFVTNLTFFGNGIFGALIASWGFSAAALVFLGVPLAVCILLILFFVKSDHKIMKEDQARLEASSASENS